MGARSGVEALQESMSINICKLVCSLMASPRCVALMTQKGQILTIVAIVRATLHLLLRTIPYEVHACRTLQGARRVMYDRDDIVRTLDQLRRRSGGFVGATPLVTTATGSGAVDGVLGAPQAGPMQGAAPSASSPPGSRANMLLQEGRGANGVLCSSSSSERGLLNSPSGNEGIAGLPAWVPPEWTTPDVEVVDSMLLRPFVSDGSSVEVLRVCIAVVRAITVLWSAAGPNGHGAMLRNGPLFKIVRLPAKFKRAHDMLASFASSSGSASVGAPHPPSSGAPAVPSLDASSVPFFDGYLESTLRAFIVQDVIGALVTMLRHRYVLMTVRGSLKCGPDRYADAIAHQLARVILDAAVVCGQDNDQVKQALWESVSRAFAPFVDRERHVVPLVEKVMQAGLPPVRTVVADASRQVRVSRADAGILGYDSVRELLCSFAAEVLTRASRKDAPTSAVSR